MENYKRCPLKKRPIFYEKLIAASSLIANQPQDLSIKRKAEDDCEREAKRNSALDLTSYSIESSRQNSRISIISEASIKSEYRTNNEFMSKNCMTPEWNSFEDPISTSSFIENQPQDLSIKRKANDNCESAAKRYSGLNLTVNSVSNCIDLSKNKMYTRPDSPISIKSEKSIDMEYENIHQRGNNSFTNENMPYNFMTAGWNSFGQPSASSIFSGLMTPPTSPDSCSSSSSDPDDLSSQNDIPLPALFHILNDTQSEDIKPIKNYRFKCDKCSKMYSTSVGLSKHQQYHCAAAECNQEKKQHSCHECGKVYTSSGALKMHIRTHTLPCKCPICGKAFSRPWLLQGHIRTHTGEKPFSCTDCNRSFADRSNLRAHQQTHVDVKKYACKVCNKSFSRMSLLNKHTTSNCATNCC